MKQVLRFTASWCSPCKMLSKNLEAIKTDLPIEVIDIDELPDRAKEYGVRSVPILVMLEDGKETKRMMGVQPLKELEGWLNG